MDPVVSTRNGVPPEGWASDPPGGVPRTLDPDTAPHPAPTEGGPAPLPAEDLPNEPPQVPPHREAAPGGAKRSHHARK